MKLADQDKQPQTEIQTTILVIDGLPYIQCLLPSETTLMNSMVHCSACLQSNNCVSCANAFNLSVLSAQNDNLMSAQKTLLLDHQQLGHISIDNLHTLYHCVEDNSLLVDKDCHLCHGKLYNY